MQQTLSLQNLKQYKAKDADTLWRLKQTLALYQLIDKLLCWLFLVWLLDLNLIDSRVEIFNEVWNKSELGCYIRMVHWKRLNEQHYWIWLQTFVIFREHHLNGQILSRVSEVVIYFREELKYLFKQANSVVLLIAYIWELFSQFLSFIMNLLDTRTLKHLLVLTLRIEDFLSQFHFLQALSHRLNLIILLSLNWYLRLISVNWGNITLIILLRLLNFLLGRWWALLGFLFRSRRWLWLNELRLLGHWWFLS